MRIDCASSELELWLELGVFLDRSSILLCGPSFQLGRSGKFASSFVAQLVAVLLKWRNK